MPKGGEHIKKCNLKRHLYALKEHLLHAKRACFAMQLTVFCNGG